MKYALKYVGEGGMVYYLGEADALMALPWRITLKSAKLFSSIGEIIHLLRVTNEYSINMDWWKQVKVIKVDEFPVEVVRKELGEVC